MKNPLLFRSVRPERGRNARELVRYGAARSNSERAAPSACVGKRFSAVRLSGIDRLDAAGRGMEAPRWLRILTMTGGSSIAVMIFKAPPQLGQRSTSISKTRLSSRAQL